MRTSPPSSAPRCCPSAPSAPSSWDMRPSCPPPLPSTPRPISPHVSPLHPYPGGCTCCPPLPGRALCFSFRENTPHPRSARHHPLRHSTPLRMVSEKRGCNWAAVVTGPVCLQMCRDDSEKQTCRTLQETAVLSFLCFSAARSQDFPWTPWAKASLI